MNDFITALVHLSPVLVVMFAGTYVGLRLSEKSVQSLNTDKEDKR